MEIQVLSASFSVCKVTDYTQVNLEDEYCFTGKTDEENSLVCITEHVPQNTIEREDDWRAFRLAGELDFALVGILAGIAGLLAEHKISIFAVSTYNTDYVFLKEDKFNEAMAVLGENGYDISWTALKNAD